MTLGEKIRYYRTAMGITQPVLAQLSGINLSTIKKLETDIMNPKPNMLFKLSEALNVSINVFLDFDIKTLSDVISLITKMDEKISMNFEADYDEEGKPVPDSIKISFKNYSINEKLATYLVQKNMQDKNDANKLIYDSPDDQAAMEDIDVTLEKIRLQLCKGNIIVSKEYE